MPSDAIPILRIPLLLLLCCSLFVAVTWAQEQQSPSTPQDEVVRIKTELVQTDVMVFDKQGRFVDGLKREQFELRVDGKPQDISFFERVTAGSFNEEAQLAAARGEGGRASSVKEAAVKPLDRGRTIIFFIDDLHLSADSVIRTRKLLLQFIEEQIGQNDQAVIASASGQIGFLQQLTDNQAVLRAAVARLNYRQYSVRDYEQPTMSEHQAISIEQNDTNLIGYFVDAVMRDNPAYRRDRIGAENYVRQRAGQLVQQSTAISTATLVSLESLMRSSRQMPGRKLVYFISDGFLLETKRSDVLDRLRRITDAAVRSGVVIYTLDARGLLSGVPDAASDARPDPTGRTSRSELGEVSAFQEPLRSLAAETGGRPLLNTNALSNVITKSLKETAVYYLLAWRPESEEQRTGKFHHVEVSVKDRPDLTVMVQRGFFNTLAEPTAKRVEAKSKDGAAKGKGTGGKAPNDPLFTALRASSPETALPTSLTVGYTNTQGVGLLLTVSVQIDSAGLDLGSNGNAQAAQTEMIGAVFDDKGKVVSGFQRELAFTPHQDDSTQPRGLFVYSQQLRITPGLYQVRVAARDRRSGRIGSATQWIEVPDISQGDLLLSSVFIGERTPQQVGSAKDSVDVPQVVISANRHFGRASWLRFLVYIYNAVHGQTAPDIALQVQIFRDDQPVLTTPLRKVPTEGVSDLTRIPYAAELALNGMPLGRYVLQVTAIDRAAKTSATQRTNFTIE